MGHNLVPGVGWQPLSLSLSLTHTHTHLAGKNITKGTEGVVECLVVDGLVQVLDKDVADARLSQRRVSLGPHDAHRTALQRVEIHGV